MLNKINILLTRESIDNLSLAAKISSLGGKAISCPLLSIVPLVEEKVIPKAEILIFISKNAVKHFFKNKNLFKYIENVDLIAAIGSTTKQVLQKHGIKNVLFPENESYNSASLLNLLQTKFVLRNKSILIIKGADGLTELKTGLEKEGARVTEIAVYKREVPLQAAIELPHIFIKKNINTILITSAFILNNLISLMQNKAQFRPANISLIVPSKRLAKLGYNVGFKQIYTAVSATEDSILQTLISNFGVIPC